MHSSIQTCRVPTRCSSGARYWSALDGGEKPEFRFLHVSTDEVYGPVRPTDPAFSETTPYAPNSPYAASKAASDHLVRAYFHTYKLPVLTTNCSNNYGPFQFPEKLIPLMILNALEGKALPVYGDGQNVRDWLYVGDHCSAIRAVLERGRTGETYNIGGNSERNNLHVVETICDSWMSCVRMLLSDLAASSSRLSPTALATIAVMPSTQARSIASSDGGLP